MDASVVNNPGAERFEFAIGDSMAVAYYGIEDGRVVLLRTEALLQRPQSKAVSKPCKVLDRGRTLAKLAERNLQARPQSAYR